MLVITRRESQKVFIGGEPGSPIITVKVLKTHRAGVRLGFDAHPDIRIDREELSLAKAATIAAGGRFQPPDKPDDPDLEHDELAEAEAAEIDAWREWKRAATTGTEAQERAANATLEAAIARTDRARQEAEG